MWEKKANISDNGLKFENYFENKDVIVLASGYSLRYVKNLKDRLQNFKNKGVGIIAVNHEYKTIDPDFLCILDRYFVEKEPLDNTILDSKNFTTFASMETELKVSEKVVLFKTVSTPNSNLKSGLYGRNTVGGLGVSLAFCLNAKRIFMLGFDAHCGDGFCHHTDDTINHRFRGHEKSIHFMEEADKCFKKYKHLSEYLEKIYNVCPNSTIKYFRKITFDKMEEMVNG